MLCLKRIENFSASHRLYHPEWSDEKNREIFGKCAHPNGHGHNYKLEVTICGVLNQETGMIFSLSILKKIIEDSILSCIDHKHLNFDVPWLSGKIPTTENLVEGIWCELEKECEKYGAVLHKVTVWETEKNAVSKKHVCRNIT